MSLLRPGAMSLVYGRIADPDDLQLCMVSCAQLVAGLSLGAGSERVTLFTWSNRQTVFGTVPGNMCAPTKQRPDEGPRLRLGIVPE